MIRIKSIFISALTVTLVMFISATGLYALDVDRYVTATGLTVLHTERHNLPFVTFTLLIKSGAYDEPPGRAGLANLTASLLMEGTEKRDSTQISEELEFIGARMGASAGVDYCTVTLTVLKKDLAKGFELFSDVVLNPSFPPAEIERKIELVKGSLKRQEEEPSFLASRAFKRAVFGDHPYGRLLAGEPDTLDSISGKDIKRFYSERFIPNNSILSVVGDLTPDELKSVLDTHLGAWPSRKLPERTSTDVPAPARKVILIDKDLTQANILLGHLGVKRSNPDYYALSVMNYILGGGGFSSRLMSSIRDKMGLAYSVYSYFAPSRQAGTFKSAVQTKNASADTVIKEILRQMRDIRTEKVTDAELEDAKAFLVGSFPRRLDTMRKISDFLAKVEFYGLGLDYPDFYAKRIKSITKEDVLRVAGEYLNPDNYVLAVVGRQSEIKIE
jgi:zinc protease